MINNALHVDVVDFFKVAFTTRDEYQVYLGYNKRVI